MKCFVFRSNRKQGIYLYLPDKDDWSAIPDNVVKLLGTTELVIELELAADRQLARTTGAEVICAIEQQGFYLQLPPGNQVTSL